MVGYHENVGLNQNDHKYRLEQGGRKTARSIRMSAAKRFSKEEDKVVQKSARYLAKRAADMNYQNELKKG